jgi:hypothetical protein
MSFQAYLDSIEAKAGKGPEEFRALAAAKGLVGAKPGEVVAWLKEEFGLGHGHAMAIVAVLKQAGPAAPAAEDRFAKLFSGGKAKWRGAFDGLMAQLGSDVAAEAGGTYVNLLRGKAKIGIVQPGAAHLDIGIKRKGVPPQGRFASAEGWNSMVTHRVRVNGDSDIDAELIGWLREAWQAAK